MNKEEMEKWRRKSARTLAYGHIINEIGMNIRCEPEHLWEDDRKVFHCPLEARVPSTCEKCQSTYVKYVKKEDLEMEIVVDVGLQIVQGPDPQEVEDKLQACLDAGKFEIIPCRM